MSRVLHLLDGAAGWEQRTSIHQLFDRTAPEHVVHELADFADASPFRRTAVRWRLSAAPRIARLAARSACDVIHAWSIQAAFSARISTKTPLVLTLLDPVSASRSVKMIRVLSRPRGFAIVCSCQLIRRRLIEGGIAPDLCVVIRPAVDFSLINRKHRNSLREDLGVEREAKLLLIPASEEPDGGHFDAFLVGALRHQCIEPTRMIVTGAQRECRRLMRLSIGLGEPNLLVVPKSDMRFEQLLVASDALIVVARGDVATGSIPWAFAANVPVIGSAVYAVAELVANKLNGLLFKPVRGKSMTIAISKLLSDTESQRRACEVARGQAYEIFGLRRFVDQHVQLYENLLAGVTPGEGIVDSAMAG